jgi:hypothetical protein
MFSSRDKAEEKIESDAIFHYLLEVVKTLYGKIVTPSGTTVMDRAIHPRVPTCRYMASGMGMPAHRSSSTSLQRGYIDDNWRP